MSKNKINSRISLAVAKFTAATIVGIVLSSNLVAAADLGGPRTMSPLAKPSDYQDKVFSPDPTYEDKPYSVKEQINIYGNKKPVYRVDPLLELFRPVYQEGPFDQGDASLGSKNLIFPGTDLRIKSSSSIIENKIDICFLSLSINKEKKIIDKLRKYNNKIEFYSISPDSKYAF